MESCDLKNKGAILELRKLITDEIDAGKGNLKILKSKKSLSFIKLNKCL